jgi:hypothetical protein
MSLHRASFLPAIQERHVAHRVAGFTDLFMVVSVHTYRYSIICTVRFDYMQFPFTSVAVALLDPLPPK